MKKLPMIKQRKKPDARLFTMLSLVALMLAVSFWGQKAAAPASVTLPVERVPLVTPEPTETVRDPAAQGAAKILPMTIDEQRLYNLLEAGPMDTDGLVEASGMPVDRVNSLLTMLEIQGIIKQTPGRMFERADEIELS